jgi:hypothetical protein
MRTVVQRQPINILASSQRKSAILAVPGYCRHSPNCIKVKMTTQNKPTRNADREPVTIYVYGRCTHAEGIGDNDDENVRLLPTRRQLSGSSRAAAVATLRQTGQSWTENYYRALGNLTAADCIAGHTSVCQTPQVLRHALYQDRRREQLHDDMILELLYSCRSHRLCHRCTVTS